MLQLQAKRLLVGVTGGIAAYKTAELVRLLVKGGATVQVAMTEAACQFVTPTTFQALSGKPVLTSLWDSDPANAMPHIHASRDIDAIIVAPASADFIAKTAQGMANDLLSTLCLARTCPLMIAPTMNVQMWDNPATQRNINQLKQDGVILLGPDHGEQACGEIGLGRMLEPDRLLQAIAAFFQPKPLIGKQVLITAGPTFEAIDAVRGITNLSSGKMGYAIAQAAIEAGANVTLISGPTHLATPYQAKRIDVVSAREMLAAVNQEIEAQDIFISVAAVADYYAINPQQQKIKKSAHILTIELAPNSDILTQVVNRPNPPFCIGFAAESENLLELAEQKRQRKKLPLLAANLVQQAVNRDESELILLDDKGQHPLPKAPKIELARQLIQYAATSYSQWKNKD